MAFARRRVGKGLAVSVGAFVLFGVVTGLIPNGFYVRMVPRTPLDYLFLTLTAVLLGLYSVQRVPEEERNDGAAALGTVGGFLAFGCPICNVVLLALFGSSALMTYFDPLRPVLGVVAVGLLGGLVYYRHSRSCETC
ncbi:hypothetical protein [Halorussus salinisoli]|uniref:hypothetical protein n=1 Tax=Halorussus salinisoli TaxID=2558242 RepID=UPI0010C22413|nr:hypothetical protein [Halorussus salinisoli]